MALFHDDKYGCRRQFAWRDCVVCVCAHREWQRLHASVFTVTEREPRRQLPGMPWGLWGLPTRPLAWPTWAHLTRGIGGVSWRDELRKVWQRRVLWTLGRTRIIWEESRTPLKFTRCFPGYPLVWSEMTSAYRSPPYCTPPPARGLCPPGLGSGSTCDGQTPGLRSAGEVGQGGRDHCLPPLL